MLEFYLLFLGYFVGSLSPGYFLGRLIKGIDIRDYKYHNTGATNAYFIVGPVYGVIVALFDFLKTPAVYYFSLRWLSPDMAILVGLAGVVGHIAPFYLRFRGGRGVASFAGLCFITLFYTHSVYALLLIVGFIAYGINVSTIKMRLPIRHLLKLGALVFPLGLLVVPKTIVVVLVAVFLGVALLVDAVRLITPSLNEKYFRLRAFAREKERKRLSGYSLFLLSTLMVISSFSKEIAVVSLSFFILGDTFAPFSKTIRFLPQRPILGDKTIAGAIVVFTISFVAGLFIQFLTPLTLPLGMIITGSAAVAVLDQFSFLLDDNILVPLGSAVLLSFMQ
jgi:glycerol-3-phosphate acyltransferase PlsY